uniref:Uncharacterized protein n=4 Tax=Avena sativa TaxID=4498 RepID=A0ACD5WNW1_AVESA
MRVVLRGEESCWNFRGNSSISARIEKKSHGFEETSAYTRTTRRSTNPWKHTLQLTALSMEIPARRALPSCNLEAKPSSWRSMALSLGSLLRRSRRAPQSPNVYRYNPERAGVGILSAVMDSAAVRPRIVGPLIHSSARDILEMALPSVCLGHGRPFRAAILSCGFCSNWIGGAAVYMYRGEIGFCKPECRDDYIMEEQRRERQMQDGGSPAPNGLREEVPTMVDDDPNSIFFTFADIL